MKHTLILNVISKEEGFKVEGDYEPSAFIAMCMSQSLQILEEDLRQAKEYNATLSKEVRKKHHALRTRLNDLARAVEELKRVVAIYDATTWELNKRLDAGEKLEDIMKELNMPDMRKDQPAEETELKTAYKFDINKIGFYQFDKPELYERTKARLIEIAECGMEEVGEYQFGYKPIMSGLYLERVWNDTDESFKDYMDWAKELIKKKLSEQPATEETSLKIVKDKEEKE